MSVRTLRALKSTALILVAAIIIALYIEHATPMLSGVTGICINVAFIVGVGGILSFALDGAIFVKLALICLIPALHVLYFPEDPAKPGLELPVAIIELCLLVSGLVIGHMVRKSTLNQDRGQSSR